MTDAEIKLMVAQAVNAIEGHTASYTQEPGSMPAFVVDGEDVTWEFTVVEQRPRSRGWTYARPNGRKTVSIGTWGEKRSFPEKKDGTFSWDKLAAALVEEVAFKRAKREASSRREESYALSRKLDEEIGYVSGLRFGSVASEGRVKAELNLCLDEARARQLVWLLQEHGFVEVKPRGK